MLGIIGDQGFPVDSDSKESARKGETPVLSLGCKYPLEKGMATHSSIILPGEFQAEEPGRPQSTGPITEQLTLPLLSLFRDDIKYKGGCV